MRTNALPTIALVTQHLRQAASVLVAKLSMIHSRFFARCSVGPDLEAGFSRRSSVVPVAHALKISVADRVAVPHGKQNGKSGHWRDPSGPGPKNGNLAIMRTEAALSKLDAVRLGPLA